MERLKCWSFGSGAVTELSWPCWPMFVKFGPLTLKPVVYEPLHLHVKLKVSSDKMCHCTGELWTSNCSKGSLVKCVINGLYNSPLTWADASCVWTLIFWIISDLQRLQRQGGKQEEEKRVKLVCQFWHFCSIKSFQVGKHCKYCGLVFGGTPLSDLPPPLDRYDRTVTLTAPRDHLTKRK